ncbi:MAG: hypothetical protein R3C14_02685 [Caldilineaceae bacterium]
MWRRLFPVILLFFLTPLIAEFLLGNLPVSQIVLVLPLTLMYGSGAVLIREVVRQTDRGWASLILLATAYGFIEEGLVTQSLFNPNYLHLRLLDYGFIPALGTGLPWLLYVISLHVIWSISVPIGLTEALFVRLGDKPWLGKVGLGVIGLLFVAGLALLSIVSYQQNPYLASPRQFTAVGVIVVSLSVVAFRLPKRKEPSGGQAPHPLLLFVVAFVAGSLLMMLQLFAESTWHWHWVATVAAALLVEALFVAFLVRFTGNRIWSGRQRFALMAGGLGVYLWFGFVLDYFTHGVAELAGHAVVAALVAALALVAGIQAFDVKLYR